MTEADLAERRSQCIQRHRCTGIIDCGNEWCACRIYAERRADRDRKITLWAILGIIVAIIVLRTFYS